jgi:hypothetical protein
MEQTEQILETLNNDTISFIPLKNGKKVIVDSRLFAEINKYKWYQRSNDGYIARNVSLSDQPRYDVHTPNKKPYKKVCQKTILLHKFVMELLGVSLDRMVVDHIDHNRLNNSTKNLRAVSHTHNLHNRSERCNANNKTGFAGVSHIKTSGKYVSRITINYKKIHLGTFLTSKEAYDAVLNAKSKIFNQ